MNKNLANQLLEVAQNLISEIPDFFKIKGPGKGDRATNLFMQKLRERMISLLSDDFSEQKICGKNDLAVDFYFRNEATIVEIALSLSKPMSEYERDVLKAVLAKELDNPVKKLVFISKPGAISKCNQPGRNAIKDWLEQKYGIIIEVHELSDNY